MKCMYCNSVSINYPMYTIFKAIRPKGSSHRWKAIGYCCESCEMADNNLRYEQGDIVENDNNT